jgi:hypothetical protein
MRSTDSFQNLKLLKATVINETLTLIESMTL